MLAIKNLKIKSVGFFKEVTRFLLKVPGPIALDFFSNFQRFWYQKKAHIFLITPGEFYSCKMYCLEVINENVTSYGNHN